VYGRNNQEGIPLAVTTKYTLRTQQKPKPAESADLYAVSPADTQRWIRPRSPERTRYGPPETVLGTVNQADAARRAGAGDKNDNFRPSPPESRYKIVKRPRGGTHICIARKRRRPAALSARMRPHAGKKQPYNQMQANSGCLRAVRDQRAACRGIGFASVSATLVQ
jgi:hypothetical protein